MNKKSNFEVPPGNFTATCMSQSSHHSIDSINPLQSSVVYSSAGSGKTWLLVSRILRLLMIGAEPRSILAITFTRKAVGEMRERLHSRLQGWAFMTDRELDEDLASIALASISFKQRALARSLYEKITLHDNPVYITTFHAFCHDIQKSFPLESPLPIGFNLTEQTGPLFRQALQILYRNATSDADLRDQLITLFDFCDGPRGTDIALKNFWHIRNEWRAFTHSFDDDPAEYALLRLNKHYATNSNTNHDFHSQLSKLLEKYVDILKQSDTKTHQQCVSQISNYLENSDLPPFSLKKCFLYANQLKTKPISVSKKLLARLGSFDAENLKMLHEQISEQLLLARDQSLRDALIRANKAWWNVGNHLLKIYQHLKSAHGLADFDDLEFETYRLLQSKEHASWLQFKIGSKIRHFLIDEFQDTNTFQWKLIQPLILAAHEISSSSFDGSVFLVGDVKQSIYRFRRANPAIMRSALSWCKQYFPCNDFSNDTSWRSGPAIIDFINLIFSSTPLKEKLSGFAPHQSQHYNLWSKVEIHPLFSYENDDSELYMRNPLTEPRHSFTFSNRYREGTYIAERIQELVKSTCLIQKGNQSTTIRYNDILILTRTRTHLAEYEQALRDHHIPFASNDSGYWLQRPEIHDIRCLLSVLDDPSNDLLLAQLLRSPIFGISSNELLLLRQDSTITLFEALKNQAQDYETIAAAYNKICDWGSMANRIPIQDLLDKIYFEWDLIQRYHSRPPLEEHALRKHYLEQFIALTLSMDSGRYPNIQRFLSSVNELESELVDQYQDTENDVVSLLTIHGAKGLEAPVVFLADTGPAVSPPVQLPPVVDWPQDQESPALILLTKNEQSSDRETQSIKSRVDQPNEEEDYNLMYVALTRARQMLIITGSASSRSSSSWHRLLEQAVGSKEALLQPWILEKGSPASSNLKDPVDECSCTIESIPPTLRKPDALGTSSEKQTATTERAIAGMFLHKCMELLSENSEISVQSIINITSIEKRISIATEEANQLYSEALNCINSPDCKDLFILPNHATALNEISILECDHDNGRINIIDRLIIYPDSIWIVDYKSQAIAADTPLQQAAKQHYSQLRRYHQSIQKTYPGRTIRCSILYTKIARIIDVPILD